MNKLLYNKNTPLYKQTTTSVCKWLTPDFWDLNGFFDKIDYTYQNLKEYHKNIKNFFKRKDKIIENNICFSC